MVLELTETDSAGRTTCTYLLSDHDRVDIATVSQQLLTGLPATSTEDRNCPACVESTSCGVSSSWIPAFSNIRLRKISDLSFSSSIAGLIASRAVLEGVGVGDANASPTAALLLTVIQDSAGRIGTIIFAHRLGMSLEPECKKWRLAADVFNDAAMIIDCLSPMFPRSPRVLLLSSASTLRALCGVAAGSAKASLSSHFAKWGNLGELNAKDSSQETVISLLGMLAGSVVVPYIKSTAATWTCLLILLCIHLGTNYLAVRAVTLHSLNRQRANLVFSRLLSGGTAPSPETVTQEEVIFETDGVLRWGRGPTLAIARVGVTIEKLTALMSVEELSSIQAKSHNRCPHLSALLSLFDEESYILWYSPRRRSVVIVLKDDAALSQLKAWAHALLMVQMWEVDSTSVSSQKIFDTIGKSLDQLRHSWKKYVSDLELAGWDLDIANIETTSGSRLTRQQ